MRSALEPAAAIVQNRGVDRTTTVWMMGIGLGLMLSTRFEVPRLYSAEASAVPAPRIVRCGDPSARAATGPVVMTLQTRDHEVTVYAADPGLSFTVAVAGSGTILAERLDAQAFAQAFPGLHRHLQRAFAEDDSATAWAGM